LRKHLEQRPAPDRWGRAWPKGKTNPGCITAKPAKREILTGAPDISVRKETPARWKKVLNEGNTHFGEGD